MCFPEIGPSFALALAGLTFTPRIVQMGEAIFFQPPETSSSSISSRDGQRKAPNIPSER